MARDNVIHSITRLFPNQAVPDILSLFLMNPDREFYQREIAEKAGVTVLQVQRALKRIEEAGFAERNRRGNRVYYRARRDHPAYEDLKGILLKTVALGDRLREVFRPLRGEVTLAFVFGSFASGAESKGSDIDLMIVGSLSSRKAASLIGPLGRELDREFNPVLYPVEEFRAKAREGNPFIRSVISGPKIWLIGNEEELESMVE
ncbi:MAG: nucleotidyltransferase domain-containing protein [Candidatus Eisenbacteria bacterium]|nr:nucleotidyltransferase domain-containing protein [Candidatus Eisenbacteria bacterium]